jgi:hypothetical protein
MIFGDQLRPQMQEVLLQHASPDVLITFYEVVK